jgi:hypothetical protein
MGRCWLGTDGQMELEKAKAWIADLNRRLLKDKLHFAVGDPSVGSSSTWSAWHEADSSFYILAVEASMTRSTPEWPVPVGCLSVEYWPRRLPPLIRNWLERRGLHVLTIELATSFMDGMHRTAWLMARGAPFVPLMVTSICSAFALEAHAKPSRTGTDAAAS